MLFLHSPNCKKSTVRIKVYGKIGRIQKKTPVFKLVRKAFHKEAAIFNSNHPPPVADKNGLYVHEDDEPVEEQTLAQDEAVLDNAMQGMPTFRGEHLSDKISDEFDSEGSNSYDDEVVAPVAAKKNAPVDRMSNVSPLPITPIAPGWSITESHQTSCWYPYYCFAPKSVLQVCLPA